MSFTYGAKMGTSEAPQPPSLTCVQQLSPSKSNLVMDKELHSGTFFRFKQDHYNNMKEDEEFPPWPRLLGVVPAPKNRDALTIYYFFEDGALYKTGFRTLGSKEVIDGEDAAEMRQREERMSGEEQLLLEEEARLPDLIHDHVLFNAKQLINGAY